MHGDKEQVRDTLNRSEVDRERIGSTSTGGKGDPDSGAEIESCSEALNMAKYLLEKYRVYCGD